MLSDSISRFTKTVPNRAMRNAGEQYLSHYQKFHSVHGSAEATHVGQRIDRLGDRRDCFSLV